jgi:hypothetical protein
VQCPVGLAIPAAIDRRRFCWPEEASTGATQQDLAKARSVPIRSGLWLNVTSTPPAILGPTDGRANSSGTRARTSISIWASSSGFSFEQLVASSQVAAGPQSFDSQRAWLSRPLRTGACRNVGTVGLELAGSLIRVGLFAIMEVQKVHETGDFDHSASQVVIAGH